MENTFLITAEMAKPILDAVTSGITTLAPTCILIMAAMIGVTMVPKLIYRFF